MQIALIIKTPSHSMGLCIGDVLLSVSLFVCRLKCILMVEAAYHGRTVLALASSWRQEMFKPASR